MATVALLSSSAAATAVLTRYPYAPLSGTFWLLVLSLGGLGAVLATPSLRRAVSFRLVVALSTVLLTVAVTFHPPHGADLWVYAMYGRTIVDHGESPYVHPPSEYTDDPWLEDLWLFRESRTFYGPLFTGMNAAVAAVGQDSRLTVRLAYQVGAGLAVAASLLLLARAGAPPSSLALLALNPVIIIDVVSQGRMDAYIGLGLLTAALLAARRKPHFAALAIAAVTLVKAPAVLALAALVPWVWRHHDLRKAITVTATGTGAIALAYLAAGGMEAVQPLLDVRHQSNDVNIWILARENGISQALGDFRSTLGPVGSTATYASIAGLILGALLLAPRLCDRVPNLVFALPVLAYLLTSVNPTARYAAWILPLLALTLRAGATMVTVVVSSAIFLMVQYRAALLHNGGAGMELLLPDDRLFRVVYAAPILLAVAGIAVLVVEALRRLRGDEPTTGRIGGELEHPGPITQQSPRR
ncbi:MAG: hypothetical protein M3Q82_01495 [Actinomycetota bacterium]|nr:hypothetical protein [Actinomycetota bacterium]